MIAQYSAVQETNISREKLEYKFMIFVTFICNYLLIVYSNMRLLNNYLLSLKESLEIKQNCHVTIQKLQNLAIAIKDSK